MYRTPQPNDAGAVGLDAPERHVDRYNVGVCRCGGVVASALRELFRMTAPARATTAASRVMLRAGMRSALRVG
jgi:hypothetical protein